MRWLLLLILCIYANGAVADPLLQKFYGKYSGFGSLETTQGPYFMNTPRDFALEISPLGSKGFRVVWETIKHKGPSPNRLVPEQSKQAADFQPSKIPNIYHAVGNTDILRGGVISWAKVKGDWLIVYRLAMGDDGIPETHIYRRVMTPQGLGLRFSAYREGKEVRTVTGRYRKR